VSQYRTLQLPEDLCASVERWMAGRFPDLESLVTFVLNEIMKDDGSKLDEQEEQLVQQRLRDLGYI